MDTESSSFHGSGSSLFEPLHIDVSTPSTNTVILTPSKITIEHSSDYESNNDKDETGQAAGSQPPNRNVYMSSPMQWSYGASPNHPGDVAVSNDRTDFIEVISEPEELCSSHYVELDMDHKGKGKGKKSNDTDTTPKKCKQFDDRNGYFIWEPTAKEASDEDDGTPRTILFHHKSDKSDNNCCDNYCPYKGNNESEDTDMEMCMSADRSKTSKIDEDLSSKSFKSNKFCCKPASLSSSSTSLTFEINSVNQSSGRGAPSSCQKQHPTQSTLNNATPISAIAQASNSIAPENFQKNNISQIEPNRCLDLSSDIRRYSKITNFDQQNASNLLPSYLARSSMSNLSSDPQQQQHQQQYQQQQPQASTSSNTVSTQANQNLVESSFFTENKFGHTSMSTALAARAAGSSTASSNRPSTLSAAHGSFELFDISTTSSMYEKPFGSISLTMQNQFEPYSAQQRKSNSNTNSSFSNNNASNDSPNQASTTHDNMPMELHQHQLIDQNDTHFGDQHQHGSTIQLLEHDSGLSPEQPNQNSSIFAQMMPAQSASQSISNDANNTNNNNHSNNNTNSNLNLNTNYNNNVNSGAESTIFDRNFERNETNRRQTFRLNGIFSIFRKRNRKYTTFLKDK